MGKFVATQVVPELARLEGIADYRAPKPIQTRRSSAVLRWNTASRDYAIKVFGPAQTEPQRLVDEFEMLSRCYRANPEQDWLGVPRPVRILRPFGALLTEWEDVPTLLSILDTGTEADRLEALRAVTRWLGSLHQTVPARSRPFKPGPVVGTIANKMKRRPQDVPDDPRFHRAFDRLLKLAQTLEGSPTPMLQLHHDANCGNFTYDGRRVLGFDFRNKACGDPMVDYVRLLLEADLRLCPAGRKPSAWAVDDGLMSAVLDETGIMSTPNALARLELQFLFQAFLRYFVLVEFHDPARRRVFLEQVLRVLDAAPAAARGAAGGVMAAERDTLLASGRPCRCVSS